MSKALELAQAFADAVSNYRIQYFYGEFKSYTIEMAKELDEAHVALSAELRRLAQVEAEHAALLKAISDAEPVAWMSPEDGIDATTSFRWIQIGDFTQPLYTLNGIKE